jgi:signal transduction histidine kinase
MDGSSLASGKSEPISVLHVEDNPAYACYVAEMLPVSEFRVTPADSLSAALERLAEGGIEMILLDLSLPDSRGLDTVQSVVAQAGSIPIIVLSGVEDVEIARRAVRFGAQYYILKEEITETLVSRSIYYAIERQRAEDLRRERDRIMEASRLKSIFLGNVSHELRTPLAGILGMNELLLTSKLSDEQIEYAESVRLCAEKLLEKVNDLLDISNIELGGMTIKEIPFSPLNTVVAAAKKIEQPATKKNLNVMSEVGADVPASVLGDSDRVKQVLLHLAWNAVKFSDCGRIQFSTTVVSRDRARVSLKFAVSDTGIGIAEEEQKFLFMPFSQVDSSNTRKHGGAGLGLAISKRLVELMDGEIGFESESGRGSTFWFIVPFNQAV